MKQALAIINPISGTRSKDTIPALLADAYQLTDIQLMVTYTKYAGHAYELACYAVEQGMDCVIAVGGDGTVNEIAKALIHTDTALAIIPKGSGNGLARALKIPINASKAIKALSEGHVQVIDCCSANGQAFFCTCGMGYDAEVSAQFAETPFRGPLSYMFAMVDKYLKYKPGTYTITLEEGESFSTQAFLVAAANASQYGNNAYIAPEASMTDGMMDLVVLRPFGDIQAPEVALRLFTGKLEQSKYHSSYKVSRATIQRSTDGVVHLDGEPVMMPAQIDIEVITAAIKVVVPNLSDVIEV